MSRHRISPRLLVEIDQLELYCQPGTVRRNHDNCPAGTDTKRRLYVTHQSTGVILGYCHNCGAAGRADTPGPRTRIPFQILSPNESPPIIPEIQPLLPRHAHFLRAYGVARPQNVASLKDDDGIIFCNGDPFDKTMNYGIIRNFANQAPKWVKIGGIKAVSYLNEHDLTRVFVEDCISAQKLSEIAGVGSTALCGTHVDTSTLGINDGQCIVVWFDNDNPTVIQHANDLAQMLTIRGERTVLVQGVSDPKKYTKEFLLKVLHDANKLSRTPTPPNQSYHVLEVQPPHP